MYLFMSGLCIYVWAMELFVHGFLVRLAVFGQTLGYCYSLGVVVVVVVQKLTICNISTITEYISLKIGVCVYSLKSNPYYQGRQIKKKFFFFRIMSLFRLGLFILHQAPHSRMLAHTCGAPVFTVWCI